LKRILEMLKMQRANEESSRWSLSIIAGQFIYIEPVTICWLDIERIEVGVIGLHLWITGLRRVTCDFKAPLTDTPPHAIIHDLLRSLQATDYRRARGRTPILYRSMLVYRTPWPEDVFCGGLEWYRDPGSRVNVSGAIYDQVVCEIDAKARTTPIQVPDDSVHHVDHICPRPGDSLIVAWGGVIPAAIEFVLIDNRLKCPYFFVAGGHTVVGLDHSILNCRNVFD